MFKRVRKGSLPVPVALIALAAAFALTFACLAGCGAGGGGAGAQGQQGADDRKLRIVGKKYTEAQLTSEIMAQLLENAGFKMERTYDMGSTICFEAVKNGEADMYPEYTGTMAGTYLDKEVEPGTSAEETYKNAKEGFESTYGLIVLPSMGFNNTYANAIRTDFAEANGIKTDSDLVPYAKDLVYGAEHAFFDRLDGYFNMCDMYGLEFKRYVKMDVALKQQSINQGQIDVVAAYTTDSWLDGSGLTVLEDDLMFFPAYYCCPVVRADVLEKYPEIETVFSVLEDCCTEEDIIYYNNLVDSGKMSITNAASQFIIDKKLLG